MKDKAAGAAQFFNRELSWLEFNQRVLDEALDPTNPLLERLKFFTIVSSNLDEFFEVRVAGLKQQIESGIATRSAEGLTPLEVFQAINQRVRKMVTDKYACWHDQLQPALAQKKIRILEINQLNSRFKKCSGFGVMLMAAPRSMDSFPTAPKLQMCYTHPPCQ